MLLIERQVYLLDDRVHRARRDARAAVDAHLRIDIDADIVRVKAVHRARRHAVRVAAVTAIIGNDVRHELTPFARLSDCPNKSLPARGFSAVAA